MKKRYLFLSLLGILMVQVGFAQQKTITGTITDETGLPLPGATVVIENTTRGVSTDFDGNFSIDASAGEVLVASFVGYTDQRITIGAEDAYNLSLQPGNELEEVVITALGIKREKKALGYSVSSLDGNQISNRVETDISRALSGQVAGVNILSGSGLSGAGTNITIRGFSSITGNNQPLIIVDGVAISNDSNETSTFSTQDSGNNAASRLLDIDPNTIENLSVLKGLSATVLYGEQGRNGVILITTKGGGSDSINKGFEISLNSSYYSEQISSLPDYQNRYGNGWQGSKGKAFSNWGSEFTTPFEKVLHPYSGNRYSSSQQGGGTFDDFFPEFAGNTDYEYRPYNSVERFFNNGHFVVNSINLSSGGANSKISLTYTNTDQSGFTPGSFLRKNNFSIGGSAKLSNKFSFQGNINLVSVDKTNPPNAASTGTGNVGSQGTSIFTNVFYTPRSVDLIGLPYKDALNRSVYYRTTNSIQNPRWTVENQFDEEVTNRVFLSSILNYEISDGIIATWKTGYDIYNEKSSFSVNKGGIYLPNGLYHESRNTGVIWDHTFTTNIRKDINEDFDIDATIGGNSRRNTFDRSRVEYDRQLVYNNFFAANFVENLATNIYREERNIFGVFASAALGFRDYLYVNFGARKDWSSTHSAENNTILYPSGSLSFLASEAIDGLKSEEGINFLKLRFGTGSSARFADPYVTTDAVTVVANEWLDKNGNIISTNKVRNRLGNPNLKPELITDIEAGIELRALNNSVGLEASIYKITAQDQILDQDLDPATGRTVTAINAGKLETKGFELSLNLNPYSSENFNWNSIVNFDTYESTIVELPVEGAIYLTGPYSNLGNYAIAGQPFNTMQGTVIKRDDQGRFIVGSDGLYLTEDEIGIIGDPNPDWKSSFINTFSYRGLNFYVQVEYTHGGDMYSATAATLQGRGLVEGTDFDRSIPIVAPGVKQDGSINDIQITANDHYWENYTITELRVYDATHLRLRELGLSYTFPESIISKTPFGSINLSAKAQNIWFKAFNFPDAINFDPEVSSQGVGNSRGFDLLTGPTAKRYGLSLNLTF
jgi:TonB-linked SusC/RagA family outer membrane protein